MTNCPNCGAPISLTHKACPYCSTPYLTRSADVPNIVLDAKAIVGQIQKYGPLVSDGILSPNEWRSLLGIHSPSKAMQP